MHCCLDFLFIEIETSKFGYFGSTFEFQRYDPTFPNLESFDKAEKEILLKTDNIEMVRCPSVEKLNNAIFYDKMT